MARIAERLPVSACDQRNEKEGKKEGREKEGRKEGRKEGGKDKKDEVVRISCAKSA